MDSTCWMGGAIYLSERRRPICSLWNHNNWQNEPIGIAGENGQIVNID
jgi:hypothetical protein